MRGYFKSLAKQSGVAVGAGGSSAPGSPLRIAPDRAPTPPHAEGVDLINSTAASEDPGSRTLTSHWSSIERGPRDHEGGRFNDLKTPGVGTEHGKHGPGADVSDSADQQAVELSETRLIRSGSAHSFAFEAKQGSEADGPSGNKGEQRWTGKGGVIRVGEPGSSFPQKLAGEQDSLSELAHTLRQGPDYSISREDLEGIREWLSSPPHSIEAIQNRAAADLNPPKVFSASEDIRSLVPNFSDRESGSQTEIQEFSLSIGSISVVVEQPAQPPPDRPASRRPVESESATGQPGVRDTFALSRSYFRGF